MAPPMRGLDRHIQIDFKPHDDEHTGRQNFGNNEGHRGRLRSRLFNDEPEQRRHRLLSRSRRHTTRDRSPTMTIYEARDEAFKMSDIGYYHPNLSVDKEHPKDEYFTSEKDIYYRDIA